MKLFLRNYFLLILLSLLTLFSCTEDSTTDSNTPSITPLSINYGISGDLYIALTNTAFELNQKGNFGSQSNFFVNPTLPNGLSLDVTNGNIKGTPTTVSLPTPYTVTATKDSKTYTNIISLGVAPSQVWLTNTNSINPYQLTVYVVGDRSQQTGVIWSSSSETLATVGNDGVVYLKTSPIGGDVVITATKDGKTDKVNFNVLSTSIDYGTSDFYIARINKQINLVPNSIFSSAVFSINPGLPNGLILDTASGSIRGTPTTVMLPREYTVIATVGGRSQVKIVTLGVTPSQVWVVNADPSRLYELSAYVEGDRTKQSGVSWSSSDTFLATVNSKGVVDLKTLLVGGVVEIIATKDGNTDKVTFNVPSTSIDYGTSDFYIALINNQIDLVENSRFSSAVFSINPSLPNGLTIDAASGSVKGTPTAVMLPSEYTVTATENGGSQTKVINLGVAPSQIWITNTNSVKPYELTAYVAGDRTKQTGVSWSSSDTSLATVNDGVVSFKDSLRGGTVVISATNDSYSNGMSFTVDKVEAVNNGRVIIENGNTNLTINSGVAAITSIQFENSPLTSVVIPDSVVYIGRAAFYNSGLTSVVISKNIKNIANSVFYGNRLTSVEIPDGVTNIGLAAFLGNQLTSVVIPNSVRTIGQGAFQDNQLTNLVIGDSVTSIEKSVFQNNQLTSVVIPNSVISISAGAFQDNPLTNVVIGDGVTTMANYAFYSNPNLVKVSLKQSLYDSLGSRRSKVFGSQVTNYIRRP